MSRRPSSAQELRRHQKVRRSADYVRCYREGFKRGGSLLTLHVHPNEAATARLGITASRKVGKAVIRHRTKRRVREIYRKWSGRRGLPDIDIVVHLKPSAGRADFETLRNELESLLARVTSPTSRGPIRRAGRGQRSPARRP